MNNKLKKKSPNKKLFSFLPKIATAFASANPVAQAAIIAGGAYLASRAGRKGGGSSSGGLRSAQKQFDRYLTEYENLEFQPIDENIVDQENIFEDMEIDTTAFEMQRKAFAQQQANILQGLKGVAGSSGAASLAQALSNQAEMASEQMGTTIGQMMARNRELRLQEESRISQAMTQIELANAEGARQFEIDRLGTLLNVAGQRVAGERADIAGRRQMKGQMASGIGSMIGSLLAGS